MQGTKVPRTGIRRNFQQYVDKQQLPLSSTSLQKQLLDKLCDTEDHRLELLDYIVENDIGIDQVILPIRWPLDQIDQELLEHLAVHDLDIQEVNLTIDWSTGEATVTPKGEAVHEPHVIRLAKIVVNRAIRNYTLTMFKERLHLSPRQAELAAAS